MRSKHRIVRHFLVVVVAIIVMAGPAYAYLDPGSGSVFLQGLLGAIVSVGIILKLYWHKILVFLRIRKKVDLPERKADRTRKPVSDQTS